MTNTKLLRDVINKSGYKLSFIAKTIGITYAGLLNKMNNKTEFKSSEILALCDLLDIHDEKEQIFFATNVDETSTK